MKKIVKSGFIGLFLAFMLIQIIPKNLPKNSTDHSKDIVQNENLPGDIKIILSKACYDCHSNQTVYPWYSYVAPVSWLVAKDTRDGREELNFSDWTELSKRKKIKILNNIAEEVEEDKMPLKIYTLIHRDAILTKEEISTLIAWTELQSDKLLGGN